MKVKIKLMGGKMPRKAYNTDYCYDCYAREVREIREGVYEYSLGFTLEIDELTLLDVSAELRARSSIHKTGLILSNGVGTGDLSYRGEYKAVFYQVVKGLPIYKVGDRVCQLALSIAPKIEFELVEELTDTERGAGGYGSTGNK